MEFGAIRNFECIRLAEKQAELEAKQEKEEEANNPMKILENRTRDSRREMAILETLEDIRELNAAHASVDPKILLQEQEEMKKKMLKSQEEEDEEEIRKIFGKKNSDEILDDQIIEKVEDESCKKIKFEDNFEEESSVKRIKIEEPKNSLSEFLKNPSIQSNNNILTKSKISSFIKKKPDTVQNLKKDQPTSNLGALSSLAEYSSDEDE